MRELEEYQKTEAYKRFTRKVQEKQKGKGHCGGEAVANANTLLLPPVPPSLRLPCPRGRIDPFW